MQHDTEVRLAGCELNGLIQQRLVFNDTCGLDPAGAGDDCLWCAVIQTHSQFIRRETAKDHGMNGTNAGAGQNGDNRFRNHRHVNDDAITFGDALCSKTTGKSSGQVAQFTIAVGSHSAGDRAVIDEGRLIRPSVVDMAVQCVVAGVQFSPGKPPVDRCSIVIKHPVPGLVPMDICGDFAPELLRVFYRPFVGRIEFTSHLNIPSASAHLCGGSVTILSKPGPALTVLITALGSISCRNPRPARSPSDG